MTSTKHLSVSIAPLPSGSMELEYYQQATIPVLITSKSPDRLLIEQVILRFQSDASVSSIYVSQDSGWELIPGGFREQAVNVVPAPIYLAGTNVFDVMVKFRICSTAG